jgi:hypothetical protein
MTAVCGTALALILAACTPAAEKAVSTTSSTPSTAVAGGPPVMRRLTEGEYKHIVHDIFGSTIKAGGRFEPDVRDGGLLEVGAAKVSVTAAGFEQYDTTARNVASQVLDKKNRGILVGCKPASETAADEACAKQFFTRVGRLLYRRPLTDAELRFSLDKAAAAANATKDFYAGLELGLAGMMVSPPFLFRREVAEPDPARPGQMRLTAYSQASRLSFFLWDSAPDEDLLDAAAKGDLFTAKGRAAQVERMIASPKFKGGVRAFFADMFEFDRFTTLSKDAALYPKFTFSITDDAPEQTLRTVVDHLVSKNGDYRDLFTTRSTFMTPLLASVYRVPVDASEGWSRYEFPENSGQAGILTQISFLATHSHPGRSSPTLRGKALREVLLCQRVPDPPGNVSFNIVQDTANPNFKTVRQRLNAHATEAMCTGCHKITDPMGLALENFDTIGVYRTHENGAPIDTSGELDGVKFTDAAGLGRAMHDNPNATACLVSRVYAYGVGRTASKAESDWLKTSLQQQFAADGYKLPNLMRRIATSDAFMRVSMPDAQKAAVSESH